MALRILAMKAVVSPDRIAVRHVQPNVDVETMPTGVFERQSQDAFPISGQRICNWVSEQESAGAKELGFEPLELLDG
jgi:hypothetical protein